MEYEDFYFFIISTTRTCATRNVVCSKPARSFNYQAVVRKASGELIPKTDVTVKFYIIDDASTTFYSEKQDVTTDAYGVYKPKRWNWLQTVRIF